MMWLRLLDQAAVRAFTGGVLYTLLVISVDQIARLVERSVRARDRGAWHARPRRLWAAITRVAALLATVGFIFALLLEGTFAANDVGIIPIDWPAHGPWVAILVPGTIALMAFFWGPYFARTLNGARVGEGQTKEPQKPRPQVLAHAKEPTMLLDALTDEASLTILRAASIPLLGAYWGVWFGLVWRLITRSLSQRQRLTTMSAERKGFYFLAGALDWLSATLFVVTGSLWVCLIGRLASHAAAQIVYRWSTRQRPLTIAPADPLAPASDMTPSNDAPATSGEDEGQPNERSEHDRRQDSDALQIP